MQIHLWWGRDFFFLLIPILISASQELVRVIVGSQIRVQSKRKLSESIVIPSFTDFTSVLLYLSIIASLCNTCPHFVIKIAPLGNTRITF